jgi:hypothetical protein
MQASALFACVGVRKVLKYQASVIPGEVIVFAQPSTCPAQQTGFGSSATA